MEQKNYLALTEWENEPTIANLKGDYDMAMPYHGRVTDKLKEYEITLDGGDEISSMDGRSSIRPKVVRKQAEWKYPSLEDPFLNTQDMFKIKPRTFEDLAAAEQNEIVINWQWSTKVNKVDLVGDIIRSMVDQGTVIVKTGWETEEEITTIQMSVPVLNEINQPIIDSMTSQPMMRTIEKEEVTLVKNNPTYEVCDLRNIIIDPTANGSLSDAKFIVHVYETDMSTIIKEKYDEESGTGVYKNVDALKKLIAKGDSERDDSAYEDGLETNEEEDFSFSDDPRKKLRAYEYWGFWDITGEGEVVPIVATWVNGIIIRMEETPFPFNDLPFSLAKHMPKKNDVYGDPDAELLKENQESIGKMMRAAHDITSSHAVGQEFIDEDFFASPLQKSNYRAGKTTYFRTGMDPSRSIFKTSVDSLPRSVLDIINLNQSEVESMSATVAFGGGRQGVNGMSNSSGARSALDATSKRELSVLRRLAENIFKDIARKTIMMNQVFLEEEQVVRVTNNKFVPVRREDLQGEFDLVVDVSTPEKDNDKAEKLNMLMQTNAASMDPGLSKIIYARIAKLWKEPDLAEEVLTYEPPQEQIDPVEAELQKIKLENELLRNQKLKMDIARVAKDIESEDSKIEERESRTSQNLSSETGENLAEARKKNAEADLLEKESELKSMDIDRKANGIDREEHMADNNAKWLFEQEREKLKAEHKLELETLKGELKSKSEGLRELFKIIENQEVAAESDSASDNKLSIAEIKNKELSRRNLDAINSGGNSGLL